MATGTVEKYTEHPSIAVINGQPKLRVFEDFFIEEQLPKWRKIKVEIDKEDSMEKAVPDEPGRMGNSVSGWGENGSITGKRSKRNLLNSARADRRAYINRTSSRFDTSNSIIIDANANKKKDKKSWFRRVLEKFCGTGKDIPSERGVPVETVFTEVKTAMMSPTNEDLLKAKKIVDTVEKKLRASGQYEIADKVSGSRAVTEAEIALVSEGNLKYITEEQVIQFMLKSERGVRIEFLRYYPNIMPHEVANKKIVFDGLLVFDNYCVMYFDPDAKKFSLIKEILDDAERSKRRDPILFGMINGSRKLYYVADWVTEDDDLTLEKLETVIGEKALDLGQENVPGTMESISSFLDRMVLDMQIQMEDEAEKGTLITDENMMEFVVDGIAPKPLEKKLRGLGIVPMSERDKNSQKKRRRHHGKNKKK